MCCNYLIMMILVDTIHNCLTKNLAHKGFYDENNSHVRVFCFLLSPTSCFSFLSATSMQSYLSLFLVSFPYLDHP